MCSYTYSQGSHDVPAVAVEVGAAAGAGRRKTVFQMTLDLHSERMGVTSCHHRTDVREGRWRENVPNPQESGESRELCQVHQVSQHYKLPGVHQLVSHNFKINITTLPLPATKPLEETFINQSNTITPITTNKTITIITNTITSFTIGP